MSRRMVWLFWIFGIIITLFLAWYIFISMTLRQKMDAKIAEISSIATISYETVSVNPFNHLITLRNIQITTVKGEKHFFIEKIRWTEGILSVDGLLLNIDKLGPRADYIRALGYRGKMPISLTISTKKGVDLSLYVHIIISVPEMGIMIISGNFYKTPYGISNLLKLSSYNTMKIRNLSMKYVDQSYAMRLLEHTARKHKTTVDEWKKHLVTILNKLSKNSSNAFKQQSLQALKKFIINLETIYISIHPTDPIAVKEILINRHDINYISNVLNAEINSETSLPYP